MKDEKGRTGLTSTQPSGKKRKSLVEEPQHAELWNERQKFLKFVYMRFWQVFGARLTRTRKASFEQRINDLDTFPFQKKHEKKNTDLIKFYLKVIAPIRLEVREQRKVLLSLFQPSYTPPDDLSELATHLELFILYYCHVYPLPNGIEKETMDFSFTKLVINIWTAIELFEGDGKLKDRQSKGGESKNKGREIRQKAAVAAYRSLKLKSGSKSMIARNIRKSNTFIEAVKDVTQWEWVNKEKNLKRINIDDRTIIRYLESAGVFEPSED